MSCDSKYETLVSVVDEIQAGRDDAARRVLSRLVEECGGSAARADDLPYYIFASALSRRLAWERSGEINLYLQRFERSQISLFNLVAEHLPTVALAGRVANDALAHFIAGRDEVTLLDFGIGTGRQEVALLHTLAQRGALPRVLEVIAVEPDPTSLVRAEASLREAARELGLELRFEAHAKVVEDLTADEWKSFARPSGAVIVNASFALHHMRDPEGQTDLRAALFRRLRTVGAEAVVLSEPSSDHLIDSLRARFDNAWHHFGHNFRLIDALDLPADEKAGLKMFFLREIEDILGNTEEARYERHEPAHRWRARLEAAGFTSCVDFGFVAKEGRGAVRVTAHEGYVGLDHGDETLVAILCATATKTARATATRAPVRRRAPIEAFGYMSARGPSSERVPASVSFARGPSSERAPASVSFH